MKPLFFFILILIAILLVWNNILFIKQKQNKNNVREYFELNAKLNFIIATGSLFIIIITYLGWNVKDEILKKNDESINKMIKSKSEKIDSLIESKNILKAGIYIVNNLVYENNKKYMFEDLLTIDNKNLPSFNNPPKLIINTNTGENLRVKEITNTYFILSKPIYKSFVIGGGQNPNYPEKLIFDLWIAEYKSN